MLLLKEYFIIQNFKYKTLDYNKKNIIIFVTFFIFLKVRLINIRN